MKDLNILVVEDDAVVRRMITLKLEKEGYPVQAAASGEEALRMLSESDFDVVITDLVMPGTVDGIGVIEAVKTRSRQTEVMVLTAHASVQTAVEAMQKGAADYLQKPVNFHELTMRLDKISCFKRLAKNSEDLREAMDVTEQNAACVIQDLEMAVDGLRNRVAEAVRILSKKGIDAAARIDMALQTLHSD